MIKKVAFSIILILVILTQTASPAQAIFGLKLFPSKTPSKSDENLKKEIRSQVEKEVKKQLENKKVQIEKRNLTVTPGIERGKTQLLNSIDQIIDKLNAVKQQINNNSNIPAETKTKIINQLGGQIKLFQSKKDSVNAAKTPDELHNISADLKKQTQTLKTMGKKAFLSIHQKRADKIIDLLKKALNRAENQINKLKNEGKNTTEAQKILSEIQSQVAKLEKELSSLTASSADLKTLKEDFKTAISLIKKLIPHLKKS